MKAIIRYAKATNSSNLKDDELNHQTDILAAVALTTRLGSSLFRVKYSGQRADLLDDWRAIVLKRSLKQGWAEKAQEVADMSLFYWLDDVCETCHGREHPKIPNAPILEIIVCPTCQGSGKKVLICDDKIKDYIRDSIESLDSMCREAAYKANRKLG